MIPVHVSTAGWRGRLVGLARNALPQSCALCSIQSGIELVCHVCARSLPRLASCCPVCALPLPGGERCGKCIAEPPAFDRSVAAFLYAFPLDRLVQSFKYQGALAFADWFAQAMLDCRPDPPDADLMVAVPLARSRQRERGFNQALEIAKPLARWTGIPLWPRLVERKRETPPQASLPWRDRAHNIRGAFSVAGDAAGRLCGKRVVVIDDVMTTGASLDELAATLKRAGAASVDNWVVARTPPPTGA